MLLLLFSAYIFLLPPAINNKKRVDVFSPFEKGKAAVIFYQGTTDTGIIMHYTETEPIVTVMNTYPFKEWDPVFITLGLRNIARAPLAYAGKCVRRFGTLWFSPYISTCEPLGHPFKYPEKVQLLMHWAGVALILCGALANWKNRGVRLLAFYVLYFNINIFLVTELRYMAHLDAVLPALAGIGAVSAANIIYGRLKNAQQPF
jgi:hypothetical protein